MHVGDKIIPRAFRVESGSGQVVHGVEEHSFGCILGACKNDFVLEIEH